jgi:hypothetical protein
MNIKIVTAVISRIEKTILGKTFLGNRIWSIEYRKYE